MFQSKLSRLLTRTIIKPSFAFSSSRTFVAMAWKPLPYTELPHNGAILDLTKMDPKILQTFNASSLASTIDKAKAENKAALWITVPMKHADVISDAGELGFKFHHASDDHASLLLWLLPTECKVPTYGTHQVGVGAVCVNSKNEILCIKEKHGPYRKWKFPGGLLNLGEDISDAACREVLEETGVKSTFKTLIAFRETHRMQFGRDDLYFVVVVTPDEKHGIPTPTPCAEEISDAEWLPFTHLQKLCAPGGEIAHPLMIKIMEQIERGGNEKGEFIEREMIVSGIPGRGPQPLYTVPLKSK